MPVYDIFRTAIPKFELFKKIDRSMYFMTMYFSQTMGFWGRCQLLLSKSVDRDL